MSCPESVLIPRTTTGTVGRELSRTFTVGHNTDVRETLSERSKYVAHLYNAAVSEVESHL